MTDLPSSPFDGPGAIHSLEELSRDLEPGRLGTEVAFSLLSAIEPIAPFMAVAGAARNHVAQKGMFAFIKEMAIRVDVLSAAVPGLEMRVMSIDEPFIFALHKSASRVAAGTTEPMARWLAAAAINAGSWNPVGNVRKRRMADFVLSWEPETIEMLRMFATWPQWKTSVDETTAVANASRVYTYLAQHLYGATGWDEILAVNDRYNDIVAADMVIALSDSEPQSDGNIMRIELNDFGREFLEFIGITA